MNLDIHRIIFMDYNDIVQQKLDAPMQLIGLYMAAASSICTLALAADVFNGIRCKMLWFPCKYFTLNAAFLTLLAVALKLPMDLNAQTLYSADWAAKLIGVVFMTVSMSNFMPSLGGKSDKAILANVVALGILVVTIGVNIVIQTVQLVDFTTRQERNALIVTTVLMFLLLIIIISSAITIPISKRALQSKYQEIREEARIQMEQEATRRRVGFTIDKQIVDEMMKNWVVAETGNPQFVAARSILSVTSGVICLLATITSVIIYVKWFKAEQGATLGEAETEYGEFTKLILLVQSTGIVVGTVAPIFRLLIAVRFKFEEICNGIKLRKEFRIEEHWIQTLVHWRDGYSTTKLYEDYSCKKYLHDAKWFALTVCIGLQIFIILLSKTLLFGSVFLASPFLLCLNHIKKFRRMPFSRTSSGRSIGLEVDELNLNHYVLSLETEAVLPTRVLVSICHQANAVIQRGKAQKPQNLIRFLKKIESFNGMREFDSRQVPNLHFQEHLNCWSLPLVTLTSIAAALPNVSEEKIKELLMSVNDGLSLTKLIDKTLDANARLKNISKAANTIWGRVAFYRKWQGIDLRKANLRCKNSNEALQELSNMAKRTVEDFKRDAQDFQMKNPPDWPVNVIAANSMHGISQTILSSHQENNEQTDDELFEKLSAIIASIMAACLTNLAKVVINMCRCNAIEKRERNLRKAFLLMGKTEQISELLQQFQWPFVDHEKAACIEEWCALIQPESNDNDVQTPMLYGEQITIVIQE